MFGIWVLYVVAGNFTEMFRSGITNTAIVRYLSGIQNEERLKYIGSNWVIGLTSTFFIAILLWGCQLSFGGPLERLGYGLFFLYYPLLAFANLPFNTALVILQADYEFGKLLFIKALNAVGFFLVIALNFLFFHMNLTELVLAQFTVNMATSAICMFKGWDGIRYLRRATVATNKTLLNFGKYTSFTLIGSNLLRSADTWIISFSPIMGTAAVALYSVPMRLTELQQIPLRSFVATAFPKMSNASIKGKVGEVKDLFYTYSGAMTYLFIFISLFIFVFAEYFVLVLGGRQYLAIDPVFGTNAVYMVRIFCIYGLLLPIDRMTGIGLDSINKPEKNFEKVVYMVIANVIAVSVAVFVFKSLKVVPIASFISTFVGVVIGYRFFEKELNLEFRRIFVSGFDFYKKIYLKYKTSR